MSYHLGFMGRRTATFVILGALALTACGGGDSDDTTDVAATSEPTATTEATTTTEPSVEETVPEGECLADGGFYFSEGFERADGAVCTDGEWSAPASTTEATTTTILDPAAEADIVALLMLGDLARGESPELTAAFVADLEPSPLDRLDILSAHLGDDGTANLIVVGTSGYGTPEYQQMAAVDTLNIVSTMWETDAFSGIGKVKVGLDLTVDGRQYFVPHESMLALLKRQMTPQQALGLA